MFDWPQMLRCTEDWAAGFWAGTVAASLVAIVGAAAVVLARAI